MSGWARIGAANATAQSNVVRRVGWRPRIKYGIAGSLGNYAVFANAICTDRLRDLEFATAFIDTAAKCARDDSVFLQKSHHGPTAHSSHVQVSRWQSLSSHVDYFIVGWPKHRDVSITDAINSIQAI